jgi:hypothetical protein
MSPIIPREVIFKTIMGINTGGDQLISFDWKKPEMKNFIKQLL